MKLVRISCIVLTIFCEIIGLLLGGNAVLMVIGALPMIALLLLFFQGF